MTARIKNTPLSGLPPLCRRHAVTYAVTSAAGLPSLIIISNLALVTIKSIPNFHPITIKKMPKQRTTEEFLKALKHSAWLLGYPEFCQQFELEMYTPYSEDKYKRFRELINYLGYFNVEDVEKLLAVAEEFPD